MNGSAPSHSLLNRLERLLLPAIILITLLVFSPVAWHDFINYDDDVYVYENPNLKDGLTLTAAARAFTTVYEVNWIPLTWLSHLLDVQLFGMNPGAHHLVSLLLHTASSALLFLFLRRVTAAPWQSAAVALLFAIHPLHVESVAWIAERKDVLSTFFMMLTLHAYARHVEKTAEKIWYAGALSLYALGLMSKPMLVTLPVVLLLLDWWPLGRMSAHDADSRASQRSRRFRLIREKIPFFVLSAVSCLITYRVQQQEGEIFQGYTVLSRAGKACIAYVTYLYKMFRPVDLAVLYPFSKYPPGLPKILFSAILLVFLTALVIRFAKRSPYLITGWFWYLITLLPVIGLIQIGQHAVADRYTYIPLIGIFILVAWGVPQLLEKALARQILLGGISVAVLAALITITSLQLRHWQNGRTMFTHTLEVTTDNWVAENNLGLIELRDGRIPDAKNHFNESIRAKPTYLLAWLNLGLTHMTVGEFESATQAFGRVLQLEPNNPQAHFSLGRIYFVQGQRDAALAEYRLLLDIGSPLAATLQEFMASPLPGGAR